MSSFMNILGALPPLLFGTGLLAVSFLGQEFRVKPLGSDKLGGPIPGWLARPFLFLGGVFLLWGAWVAWKQP